MTIVALAFPTYAGYDLVAFYLRDGGIYTILFWFVWILAGGLFPIGILFVPSCVAKTSSQV
ncbi:hypothetical protein [Candidatus Thiosymbion oneisti]|uniref:hypothetical protein n=1 Tax=Candidatus Thiosymbion oneisti TaxID=589554 RepID=UPI00159EF6C2|nr:hypothetical protein [Candidatus Thiosymbion oneisti]